MSVLRSTFGTLADKFLSETFLDFAKTLVIETSVETADGSGGFTIIWSTFATVKGFVFPVEADEVIDADRLFLDQLSKFQLKPIAGLTSEMRINYDSNLYQIRSIKNIAEAGVWIEIIGEKGVAQ